MPHTTDHTDSTSPPQIGKPDPEIDFDSSSPPVNSQWGDTDYEKVWDALIKKGGISNKDRQKAGKLHEPTAAPTRPVPQNIDYTYTENGGFSDSFVNAYDHFEVNLPSSTYDYTKTTSPKDVDSYSLFDISVTYDKEYSRSSFPTTNPDRPTTLVYTGQPQLKKVISFSIVRDNKPPKIPRFAPAPGENIELMRRVIQPLEIDSTNGTSVAYKISGKYEYVVLNPRHMSRFVEFPIAPHVALKNPLLSSVLDLKHDVFTGEDCVVSPYLAEQGALVKKEQENPPSPTNKPTKNQPGIDGGKL